MRQIRLEDCAHRIHRKEGLKAAMALVMLVQAQIQQGTLALKDTGLNFGQVDVTMTQEQFVNIALEAINHAIGGNGADLGRSSNPEAGIGNITI